MRRLLAAGSLLASAALGGVLTAMPTSAQTTAPPALLEVGWWTDMIGVSADDGNLVVGESPDGTRAVSALRIQAANGLSSAFVDLVEVDATASGVGGVVACVGPSDWQAVSGGDLADAPRADCDDADVVPVQRDDETARWAVELTAILRGRTGEVTVVLVPDGEQDGSGLAPLVPWTVEWQGPPTFAAESAVPATTTTTTTTTTTSPPTVAAPATASYRSPPTTVRPSPVAVSPTTTVLQVAPPTTAAPSTTVAVSPGFAAARPVLGDSPGGSRPIGQALFFLALALTTGTVAGVAHWKIAGRGLV